VVPLPGPSAVTAAIAASGFNANAFHFEGFLPRKRGKRMKVLNELKSEASTLIFFESPYRVVETLNEMREVFGDRQVAIARELTKVHEEMTRATMSQVIDRLSKVTPRGEFTLVVQGTGGKSGHTSQD
jgi:16S rRNA (cytidine1402-2'-O)-methyltransferase